MRILLVLTAYVRVYHKTRSKKRRDECPWDAIPCRLLQLQIHIPGRLRCASCRTSLKGSMCKVACGEARRKEGSQAGTTYIKIQRNRRSSSTHRMCERVLRWEVELVQVEQSFLNLREDKEVIPVHAMQSRRGVQI